MQIARRIQSIQPSTTLVLAAKAKALQRAGQDVLNFTAGEPDFAPAEHILDAAKKAIDENFSYYTATEGIAELRQAVVEKEKRENQLDIAPQNVIITNGGKEALFLLFQTILEPGDEVIMPTPYWISYAEQVRYAGGVPVFVPSNEQFRYTAADIATRVTARTKAILINCPSNPTGVVLPAEELQRIAELAEQKNFLVITDEVYEHFLYDGRAQTRLTEWDPELQHTIIVNAVSKTYCMTGWRVGYAVAHPTIINGMSALKSHLSSNTSSIAQKAAVAALTGPQDAVSHMHDVFEKRRNLFWKGINAISGYQLHKPEGAFYAFVNCSGVMKRTQIKNSFELCERLLAQAQLAVVPGEAFGEEYTTFIRFSFASSEENIRRGLERFAAFANTAI